MKCRHGQPDSITIFKAYQAVARTRMAEHVFWPLTKLSYFNDGKDTLEACISRCRSLETVYLRLVVQLNAPGLLGYNDNLEADRTYVERELFNTKLPPAIVKQMRESLEQ